MHRLAGKLRSVEPALIEPRLNRGPDDLDLNSEGLCTSLIFTFSLWNASKPTTPISKTGRVTEVHNRIKLGNGCELNCIQARKRPHNTNSLGGNCQLLTQSLEEEIKTLTSSVLVVICSRLLLKTSPLGQLHRGASSI